MRKQKSDLAKLQAELWEKNKKMSYSLKYYYLHREKSIKKSTAYKKNRYQTDAVYRKKEIDRKKGWYRKNLSLNREKANNIWAAKRNTVLECVSKGNGVKCVRCNFSDPRALQIDHIYGGGRKEIKKFKDNKKYLEHIKTNLENYQILCANCNWIKRYENKETKK